MADPGSGTRNIRTETDAFYSARKQESAKNKITVWDYVNEIQEPAERAPNSQHWNHLNNKIK